MPQRIQTPPAASAKPRYCVTNRRDHNRALVARGSITLWIDEEVVAGWRATGGKGLRYSDAAILCGLSLRVVFRLPLRQTQGFLLSLKRMLGLTIDIPHYSSFCRRAAVLDVPQVTCPAAGGPLHLAIDSTGLKVHGEGEWKVRMHGPDRRRVWRKLHLGVDTTTGEIAAHALTPSETHDATELDGLLAQVARAKPEGNLSVTTVASQTQYRANGNPSAAAIAELERTEFPRGCSIEPSPEALARANWQRPARTLIEVLAPDGLRFTSA